MLFLRIVQEKVIWSVKSGLKIADNTIFYYEIKYTNEFCFMNHIMIFLLFTFYVIKKQNNLR